MTTAYKAAVHILRRMTENADFAHLMIGTESFDLCVRAVAEYRDHPADDIRREVEENAANRKQKPKVVRLQEENDRLNAINDMTRDFNEYGVGDEHVYDVVEAVKDLVRLAELGQNVLTVENLKNALDGISIS